MRMRCRHWLKILNVNNFNYVCLAAYRWRRRICDAHHNHKMHEKQTNGIPHSSFLEVMIIIIFFFAIKYVALSTTE